ncbi:MAG: CNP1-like family protein [Proteobacteria bacterium]|nr:CNP1-like family protein [Pseudomonadota bacterium]
MKNLTGLLCALLIAACGSPQNRPGEAPPGQTKLTEREQPLPAFPRQESLLEFYVSELTANHFFVDPLSIGVEQEGIVLYTIVVKTAGGATNINFEGINCSTGQLRIFATGRNDGLWSRARISEWQPIENKLVNRHHAALKHDYFCPGGRPLVDPAEGVDALRRGRHPEVL